MRYETMNNALTYSPVCKNYGETFKFCPVSP